MKNLKELKKVKVLSKKEQKAITGGIVCYRVDGSWACGEGCCIQGRCAPEWQCE